MKKKSSTLEEEYMYMRIGAKPNPEAWMNTTPRRPLDSIRASVMAMGISSSQEACFPVEARDGHNIFREFRRAEEGAFKILLI